MFTLLVYHDIKERKKEQLNYDHPFHFFYSGVCPARPAVVFPFLGRGGTLDTSPEKAAERQSGKGLFYYPRTDGIWKQHYSAGCVPVYSVGDVNNSEVFKKIAARTLKEERKAFLPFGL
ncbi:MAG: hypothetical protein LBS97_05195 [Treponema sp.]|jgi:hypothetical protein|nr:hypothetical protein [Treponema sp.]